MKRRPKILTPPHPRLAIFSFFHGRGYYDVTAPVLSGVHFMTEPSPTEGTYRVGCCREIIYDYCWSVRRTMNHETIIMKSSPLT